MEEDPTAGLCALPRRSDAVPLRAAAARCSCRGSSVLGCVPVFNVKMVSGAGRVGR